MEGTRCAILPITLSPSDYGRNPALAFTGAEVARVPGRYESGKAAKLQRRGRARIVERGRHTRRARRLGQVHEVDPLNTGLPDDQPHPQGHVGGGQVHESEPGCQPEPLHQNLRLKTEITGRPRSGDTRPRPRQSCHIRSGQVRLVFGKCIYCQDGQDDAEHAIFKCPLSEKGGK